MSKFELISKRGQRIIARISVMKGNNSNLLGKPEIVKLGLVKTIQRVTRIEDEMAKKYPNLFKELGTLPDVFRINLREDSTPVCLQVPRRLPIGLKEATKQEIARMEKLGVIKKIEKPTKWCSGMVVAPKSKGKVRICVDLTQLNKSVLRENFPLPTLEETIAELEDSVIFSKMDANSGFWQTELAEESQELTTFITPFGRYMFQRMPFGISAAPEFFQRQVSKIIGQQQGVVCMMDDILVVGKNKEEHDIRLHEVLDKLNRAGLTLNREKCQFGVDEVKFLGHILNKEGIRIDPEKEKAIKEMPAPIDRKSLRRFLAMVNYLGRFSPLLAEVERPLRLLDKNNAAWCWNEEQQKGFEKIKEIISTAPVLTLFDNSSKHRITADASKHTLGAALLQMNREGRWQPVAYASRKMSEAEQKYGQIEKEALAVAWACDKFDFYLVGRDFEVETDHKPLVPLLGNKDLSDLPLRIQRFKTRMMRYRYNIFHTPGDKMFLADLLSRPASKRDEIKLQRVENHASRIVAAIEDVLIEKIKGYAETDETYQTVMKGIETGWEYAICGEAKKLKEKKDELSVVNGMIMWNARVYIPINLRKEIMEKLHSGHQGQVKTYRRCQDSVWWPGIRKEIIEMVERCEVCIKNRRISHEPMCNTPLPEKPWQEIGTDLFEFEGRRYVIFMDYYSKWIEVVQMNNQTGRELALKFAGIIARLGAPLKVRSDNGPCYNSPEWREILIRYNIIGETSSPRYPESNGLAERAVGIIKSLWRKEKDKNLALLAYRTTPLESGNRPDELMYNRRIRNELPGQHLVIPNLGQFKERDRHLKERQKSNFDRVKRPKRLSVLKEGDRVWVKINHEDEGREATVIKEALEPNSFWVAMNGRRVRRNRKHLRLLFEKASRYMIESQDKEVVSNSREGNRKKTGVGDNSNSNPIRKSTRDRINKRDNDFVYSK